MNYIIFSLGLFMFILSSCGDNSQYLKHKIPIKLGDSSMIVNEDDSHYLKNFTEDIAPANKKSSERQITQMMAQVDSMKTSQKLENQTAIPTQIRGFTINFKECTVVFNGLLAHALNVTQNERKLNSVSYLKDGGQIFDMNLQVIGMEEVKVEERLFTKLYIENDHESYQLEDLGKFSTTWYSLVGKNDRFVSVGKNNSEFTSVDHQKIKNALDRALRKKRKNRKEIEIWMKAIEHTQGYSDAPCKVKIVSAQWKISGTKEGKKVQKLIQFDEPES